MRTVEARGLDLRDVGRKVSPANAMSIIAAGDSITEQDKDVAYPSTSSGGFLAWANFLLFHAFDAVYNAGVGGNRSDELLARLKTDVLSRSSGWVSVLIGTNDIAQDVAAPVTIANLHRIYDSIRRDGRRLIVCTIPPTGYLSLSTSRVQSWHRVNHFIKRYAATTPGVVLVDWNPVLVDVTTGRSLASCFTDGTHPNIEGARRMGKVFADAVRPHIVPNIVRHATPSDPDNYLGFGMFTGTTGTTSSTNSPTFTGTVPDSFLLSAMTTGANWALTRPAKAFPEQGAWWQLQAQAGNASGVTITRQISQPANAVAGDVLDFYTEMEADQDWVNVANGGVEILLQATSSTVATVTGYDLKNGTGTLLGAPSAGMLRASVTLPVNCTGIFGKINIRLGGGGTVRLGNPMMRRRVPTYVDPLAA